MTSLMTSSVKNRAKTGQKWHVFGSPEPGKKLYSPNIDWVIQEASRDNYCRPQIADPMGANGRQRAPKCKILAKKSEKRQTLSPILNGFPLSNFKFRPIFGKFRGLSFISVISRNRHFHSFRAKNRLQKSHFQKSPKMTKNSKKIFLLKMVPNMPKHVSLKEFFEKKFFFAFL